MSSYFLFDDQSKRFFELQDGLICGRTDGQVNFPEDDVISRKHCQFKITGSEVFVMDLGSTNGTKVNNVSSRSMAHRRVRLNDVVEFGHQRLILTNQNVHAPAYTRDAVIQPREYKVGLRKDGELTSHLSRMITKKTVMLLDPQAYRQLRFREVLRTAAATAATAASGSRLGRSESRVDAPAGNAEESMALLGKPVPQFAQKISSLAGDSGVSALGGWHLRLGAFFLSGLLGGALGALMWTRILFLHF